MIRLSIVIPAKNEQANITPLIAEISEALDRIDYEVIVVDDGSEDGTYDESLRAANHYRCRIHAIRHSNSFGQSTALMTGVRQARGSLIVTLDGDGQNNPADIPPLLESANRIATEHFCVVGYRKQRRDTPWKKLQSRVANRIRNALLHDGVPDTGCGLKLIPKQTFLQLPWFDHGHRFIPALVRSQGGTIAVVEVDHRERRQGLSNYTAWNRAWVGMVDLLGVMWLCRRTRLAHIEKFESSETQPL